MNKVDLSSTFTETMYITITASATCNYGACESSSLLVDLGTSLKFKASAAVTEAPNTSIQYAPSSSTTTTAPNASQISASSAAACTASASSSYMNQCMMSAMAAIPSVCAVNSGSLNSIAAPSATPQNSTVSTGTLSGTSAGGLRIERSWALWLAPLLALVVVR